MDTEHCVLRYGSVLGRILIDILSSGREGKRDGIVSALPLVSCVGGRARARPLAASVVVFGWWVYITYLSGRVLR